MKLMIASDLHGDAVCTEMLLRRFRESGAERLVLLGDLLYHGPRNDLPAGYDPKQVISLLNAIKHSPLCVRGNCDTEVDQMVLNFPMLSDTACLFVDGRTIVAAHGHHDAPPLCDGDVLLGGHTHVPAFEQRTTVEGASYLHINPGSVSLPKENSPKSYVLLDGDEVTFYDLDGTPYRQEKIGG
ncbi:MAG: phosphodiesterase [Clostridia bacterium]|nr:phosphodiesterase [Clostridia bacterium]